MNKIFNKKFIKIQKKLKTLNQEMQNTMWPWLITSSTHCIKNIHNFIFPKKKKKKMVPRDIMWPWVLLGSVKSSTLLDFAVTTALHSSMARFAIATFIICLLCLSLNFSLIYHHFILCLTLFLSSQHFISH